MPEKLTIEKDAVPFIKNLDGRLLEAKIEIEKNFEGCTEKVVCYSITHSNVKAVPAGASLSFSITGTSNQGSEQPAGAWGVWT